jgi:hypothetical protein
MVATATSPSRTPSTRATLAPAAGRPARTLTPAQALDLPPPTPAPVLKTPPPIVYAAPPRAAAVRPLVTETDSGPTRVSPQHARGAAAPGPLVTESESGPTNVVLSPSMVTEIAPVLTFPDSDAIIDSVTMEPEAEQPAAAPLSAPAAFTLPAPETPRRGTALMALGMGLGIVVIAFVGFKLLRGSKAPVSPVTVATNATPPEPVEPVVQAPQPAPVAEEPAPPPKAALAARSKTAATPSTIAPQPVARAAVPRAIVETHEVDRPAAERHAAAPHRRVAAHKPKAHERASHKRSLAMREPAAKRNPTAAAPEHSDPRPLYEHGNALLFAGDGKGAIAAYRDAVKNAPSDPIGFRGLGLAYEQQGEPALAIRALRRYLKLAPDAPDRELISKRIDKLSKRAKSK